MTLIASSNLAHPEVLMLRCLLLFVAFIGLSPVAFAQVCCPGGCVQDGARCIRTGPTPSTCPVQACPQSRQSTRTPAITGSGGSVRFPTREGQHMCCDPTRAPGGSYTKTCRDLEMRCVNANELLATCGSGHGWVRSTLPNVNSCLKIENINGELKCKKRTKRPRTEC